MKKKEVSQRDLKIFGLIWGAIFAVIGYKSESLFVFLVSLFFIFSAISFPQIYLQTRFYQVWIRFGDFLGKVNGFLISFILFYGIFTPVGIILKILKKDPLKKKLEPNAKTYFIDREANNNGEPHDMKHQF